MRYMQYVWLALFLPSICLGAIDLDVDKNGATDINRGGSNATTAAGARSNLGLGNVNNTSDTSKPVSTAQQSALDLKSNITCFADATAFNACFALDWITAASIGLGTSDNPSFLSVHASGGNLAAANAQVTKKWITGLSYTADLTSVIYGGKHYICTSNHTAGSTTEPGVGASWATVWSEVSGAGDDLGSAAAADVIALFGGGSCSGYLYSDGTCSTPSGAAHDAVTLGTDAATIFGLSTQEITLDSQTANYFFAAPNGSAGDPTFRAIVAADIPTLNQNTTGTAAGLTAQYVDWNSASGGSSIANKPTIPTASSLSVDDLITLSGVETGAVNLGTFTGTTIADSSTVKTALQAVETEVETKADANNIAFIVSTLPDLKILDTAQPANGSVWVDDTLAYNATDDHLHLWSISKIGSELAGKQASDADLTTWAGITPGANVGTFLATPSSANLRGAVTDESGTGALIFAGGDIAAATATTASAGDNDTSVATTAFVQTAKKSGIQPVCAVIPAAVATDDYPIFKAPAALTITGGTVRVYAIGGTNVVGGFDECTGTNGTCSSVTAVDADITGTAGSDVADDGTLTNGTIASGNWVQWHTTSVSGTNTSVSVCFSYTLD